MWLLIFRKERYLSLEEIAHADHVDADGSVVANKRNSMSRSTSVIDMEADTLSYASTPLTTGSMRMPLSPGTVRSMMSTSPMFYSPD